MHVINIRSTKLNKLVQKKLSIFLILIFLPGFIIPLFSNEFSTTNVYIKDISTEESNPESIEIFETNHDQGVMSKIQDLPSSKPSQGFDFLDAIEIALSEQSGDILKQGSQNGELTDWIQVFYKFSLNDSGPVEVQLTSTLGSDEFQFFLDVFIVGNYDGFVGTAGDGIPLSFHYFAPDPGYNYLAIGGFPIDPNFDFDFGDTAPFTVTVKQLKKGVAPEGAESKFFNSIAYEQVENIFKYFTDTGFIQPNGDVTLSRNDDITGLDPTDPYFFKGIGLSIYGIIRAADFLANSDGNEGIDRTNALIPYLELALKLFNVANDTNNVLQDSTNSYYLYGKPFGDVVTLTDNAYMLLGLGEIIYFASGDQNYFDANTLFITQLADWAIVLADSIINVFEDTDGIYVDEVTGYGTSESQGDLVKLESMAILAEVFNELNLVANFATNFGAALPIELQGFPPTEPQAIRNEIKSKLLITNDSNTTIDLITGPDVGIGVEFWNRTSGEKSNTSTLIGNLAYALHLTSQSLGDIDKLIIASDVTTNLLRLFSSPTSNLLYERKLIINDGTILPSRISTLENSIFVLLAQRLEIKWTNDIFPPNPDISRSWGRKAMDNFEKLMELAYDDVENAVFGMFDDQAKKLVSDDNRPESNRFVANAFLNSVLVRIFPAQLGAIAENNVIVDETSELSLELSQILLTDALNWYDFIIGFKFDLSVSIASFSFSRTETVDLADFFVFGGAGGIGNSKFIPIQYTPTEKGNFTILITLSVEGRPLLVKEIELTALGLIRAELSNAAGVTFATDDSSFTGEFTLIDDQGVAVPNLNVNTSLAFTLDKVPSSKYFKTGRSDASGKVSVKFDTSTLLQDGVINQTELLKLPVLPNFVFITLYINVTNAESLNLKQAEGLLKIRLQVVLAKMSLRTSPTILEITQGTTETFSFTVTALNQDQEPVSNAQVSYSIVNVEGSSNTAFTNADGEAVISFRDNDLFGLSNLVIANDGKLTKTNVSISVTHSSYPSKTLNKPITIQPNSIKINANPVQVRSQRGSFFQPSKPAIDVEVATEDLFGKQIISSIELRWIGSNNNTLESIVPLIEQGAHQSPFTFSIDPSNLPEGEHQFEIRATKDGITKTAIISAQNPNPLNQQLKLNRQVQEVIDRPVIQRKTITIEQSNILEDAFITILALSATFILAYLWTRTKETSLVLAKFNKACPHCDEYINRHQKVCPNCGRDVDWNKGSGSPPTPQFKGIENPPSEKSDLSVTQSKDGEDKWPDDDPYKIGPPLSKDEQDD